MMSKLFSLCLFAWFVFTTSAIAEINDSELEKIEYLKAVLASSGCEFERNGKRYDAEQAVSHINKKYDYFRDEIDSAEEFIGLTATKSTMSGKPYYIYCPGKEKIESSAWLHDKLGVFTETENAKR